MTQYNAWKKGSNQNVITIIIVVSSLYRVLLFVTLWAVASQAPLSTGFLRQEYWSGFPFPSQGDRLDPRIEPTHIPCIGKVNYLPLSHQGSPLSLLYALSDGAVGNESTIAIEM